MNKTAIIASSLTFAAFVGLCAQPVMAQTIEDALAKAYLNNPTLLSTRAGLRSTDESVPQALADWRPSVEVTSSLGAEAVASNTSTGTDRNQSRRPKDLGVSVTQPLFRGGRTLAATSGAENDIRAARARLLDTEQNILLQAATAYLNVYRDQAVLRLNQNNEEVLQRQLEATRDRFEVGEITRTDVHQAEARLARSKADRIQSAGDLETSRANYLNIVGEPAPATLRLPERVSDLPVSAEEAVRIAVVNNPGVIAAEFDRRSSMDNVDEVWGELLPELELTASSTRELQTSTETSARTTHAVTLNLTIPIYQQGGVYSRLRQARQDAAESTLVIDTERRDAAEAGTQAYESLVTARAQVDAFQTQIEASIVALEGVQREAAVGSRTVLDILDAEQELLDSRVSHVRSERDELVAAYELMSALGRLTAKDLGLSVDLYDPREHYNEVRDKWFGGTSSGGVK
ncbi:TolC family outer membrane protein [Thalassospiraceae bacterium LMO-JJ14]|nr:TolC family outer membrane protein [Thalassospiraceae bacterium LMO-JJ14]